MPALAVKERAHRLEMGGERRQARTEEGAGPPGRETARQAGTGRARGSRDPLTCSLTR